jgi:hypothetical protein
MSQLNINVQDDMTTKNSEYWMTPVTFLTCYMVFVAVILVVGWEHHLVVAESETRIARERDRREAGRRSGGRRRDCGALLQRAIGAGSQALQIDVHDSR